MTSNYQIWRGKEKRTWRNRKKHGKTWRLTGTDPYAEIAISKVANNCFNFWLVMHGTVIVMAFSMLFLLTLFVFFLSFLVVVVVAAAAAAATIAAASTAAAAAVTLHYRFILTRVFIAVLTKSYRRSCVFLMNFSCSDRTHGIRKTSFG